MYKAKNQEEQQNSSDCEAHLQSRHLKVAQSFGIHRSAESHYPA